MQLRRALALAAMAFLAWSCRGESRQTDAAVNAAAQGARDGLDCGVDSSDVQIERGVGVLRIGVNVGELRERCRILRDTTLLDNEGMPARELRVALGRDSAVAEVIADTVWRVRLASPRFRAGHGLGVGSTVSALAASGGARALVGEGEIYVTVPSTCGVSYRIAGVDFARVAAARSAGQAMGLLPDTARVDLMLVLECPDASGR